MKTSALLLLFTFGCSVDSTGLLPEDGGPDQGAGTQDASIDVVDQPDAVTNECSAGETLDCLSVGICVARQRPCIDGSWGACEDTVNGGMPEVCTADNLDEDCDGMVNEGCTCTEDVVCGETDTAPCSLGVQRCVDGVLDSVCEGEVPPQDEICDGVDNDCDERFDEGVLNMYFTDEDRDGVGAEPIVQRCSLEEGLAIIDGDCDDMNAARFPGNTDACDDADNDCDEFTDEDGATTTYYLDDDGDGYGAGAPTMSCSAPGDDYVTEDGDCLDSDFDINPGASEECDLIDNNCSTTPDDDQACHNDCTAHVYDGHVYQFCERNRRWGESRNDCDRFGDDGLYELATVDDEAENIEMNDVGRSINGGAGWWIGLTDAGGGNEGTFRWLSGSASNYRNWDSTEPNNQGGEDCTELRANGRWNDADCDDDRYYICEEVD